MKKSLNFLKSLYLKEAILYTISLYLYDYNYTIDESSSEYIISIEDIDDTKFKFFKQELNFNNLRFQIADKNKDLRKNIISKALWSINVD